MPDLSPQSDQSEAGRDRTEPVTVTAAALAESQEEYSKFSLDFVNLCFIPLIVLTVIYVLEQRSRRKLVKVAPLAINPPR